MEALSIATDRSLGSGFGIQPLDDTFSPGTGEVESLWEPLVGLLIGAQEIFLF